MIQCVLCIFQVQHKWLDVSNLTLSSWDTSHDSNMSSWDTSHDTNITVTLSGLQLQTCYWNILGLNLNISKSMLPEMTLTVDERKRNDLNGVNKPSVIVYNSSIQHLIGSCINLSVFEVFIIDPQEGNKAVLMLKGSWVEIVDSRFHGIHVTGEADESAAVLYVQDCQANLKSSHFTSNSAYQATINSDNSRISVRNCKFQQNQGTYGGALSTTQSSVSLMSSEFKWNQAPGGGAMNIQDRSELTIHNCKFQQNQATYGGALAAIQSNGSLTSSEFIGNQAAQGGAINAQDDSILAIKKCSFKSNKATRSNGRDATVKLKELRRNLRAAKFYPDIRWHGNLDLSNISHTGDLFKNGENEEDDVHALGGAILGYTNVTITIIQSEFTSNTAAGGFSGAIAVNYNSELAVHSSLFTNNTASQGGAIDGDHNVTTIITQSQFVRNSAADGFGGGLGGAIYLAHYSHLEVNNSLFTNNTGRQGGTICLEKGVNAIFTNTSFIANSALFSSIQKVLNDDTQEQANIRKIELNKSMMSSNTTQSNTTKTEQWNSRNKQKTRGRNDGHSLKQVFMISNRQAPLGGAMFVGSDVMVHIQTSMFINNTAANGGYGGALSVAFDATLHLEDSLLHGNSAEQDGQGGAMNVQYNVIMTMKNTTLSNNQADVGGGLVAMTNVDLHIINCTFLNNSAHGAGAMFIDISNYTAVTDSLFINNTGYETRGALAVQRNSDVCIVRCKFSGNTGAGGSDIYAYQSVINVSHVSFTNISPNIIYLTSSSTLHMSVCNIKNNSLRRSTQGNDDIFLIEISGNSNTHISDCNIMYNDFHGIGFVHLIASMFYIDKSNIMYNSLMANFKVISGFLSMENCNVSFNNISSNGGLITLKRSRISMDNCRVSNNSAGGLGGVIYSISGNITIWNSSFSSNSAKQNGGVISLYSQGYSSLSVVNTLFHRNHAEGDGAVINTLPSESNILIDIALDSCVFIGNTAQSDTALYLDTCSSLRTDMCHFETAIDSSHCSIYFILDFTNADYLTYRTQFHTGGRTLNSWEHGFLQKAVSAGVIVIDYAGAHPYNVTNEETPYAAGEHQFSSTFCPNPLHKLNHICIK